MPERTDISPRGLAIGAAIVIAGIAASVGAAAYITDRVAAPATGPSRGEPPKIEGARLQTAPEEDIRAYEREKRERLSSTGPVDDGHVHIPIERAMRMLAEQHRR